MGTEFQLERFLWKARVNNSSNVPQKNQKKSIETYLLDKFHHIAGHVSSFIILLDPNSEERNKLSAIRALAL